MRNGSLRCEPGFSIVTAAWSMRRELRANIPGNFPCIMNSKGRGEDGNANVRHFVRCGTTARLAWFQPARERSIHGHGSAVCRRPFARPPAEGLRRR